MVKKVLQTEAWRSRIHKGKLYEFERFVDFLTAKPLAGCGYDEKQIEKLIEADVETLAMWRDAMTAAKHVHRDADNVPISDSNNVPIRGNSKSYTVSRLRREAPQLYAEVREGRLSANAAAIQAGFRKSLTPLEQIKRLLLKLSDAERDELREHLAVSCEAATASLPAVFQVSADA